MKDKSPIIFSVSTMEDISKLKKMTNVKYINIDISNPNLEVIYYLIDNGQDYSYSEMINGINGYIYVSYEIFRDAELEILDIINNVPTNLDELEIARYLYIAIGKTLGYDINILPDKNETFNLKNISILNTTWGSIKNKKGTNASFAKTYLYLCRIMNIDCSLVSVGQIGYLKNMITLNDNSILTDITQDIPYIQANFRTKFFNGYNDNLELDKKIKYIANNYNEDIIEQILKKIDYSSEDIVKNILIRTQKIINVNLIKPIELGIIYDTIFNKYCPNYNISINNLFINDIYNTKEHFVLISYNDKYYSYNYTKSSFMELSYEELQKNIESKKIGMYLNEKIPNFNKEKTI